MRNGFFQRTFELDRKSLNENERSIELSVSSETPVRRWFGDEILLHGRDNVDLSSMDSALMNHDPDQIVGRWEDKRIEKKRVIATLYFDQDEEGDRAMRKVKSGSLKGASVRYAISKFREVREGEEWNGYKGPAYIATKWRILETSLTPIPADPTVGVGRDATRSLEGITIERSTHTQEVEDMTIEELRAQIEREREESAKRMKAIEDSIAGLPEKIRQQMADDAKPKMRITGEEYNDLLSRASAISPDAVVQFSGWVAEGHDSRSIERKLFDLATCRPDAKDGGGDSPDGTGLPGKGGGNGSARSFKDLDDDSFIRGLTSPSVQM